MEITLSRLLEGKPTIIKGKEFSETKVYVKPFIDEMSKFTDKFIVNVIEPSQTIISDNADFTFNKVWIQAVMPNSDETYHFVYALDTRVPVFKVFRSHGSRIFNSEWLTVDKLEEDVVPNYSIENLMSYTSNVDSETNKMMNTFLDSNERHKVLGQLIERAMLYNFQHVGGKVKLSPGMIIKAYENVYMNSDSEFFVKETEECSVWNYFNALADLIKDDSKKDICNYAEKCNLCYNLFKSYIC